MVFKVIFYLGSYIFGADWGSKDHLFKTQFPLFVVDRSTCDRETKTDAPGIRLSTPDFRSSRRKPPFSCDQAAASSQTARM